MPGTMAAQRRGEMRMPFIAYLRVVLVLGGLGWLPASAQQAAKPVRLGFLTDMSGPGAIDDGPGGVAAARMAIADFAGTVLGRPIELLVGDHQNKADIGLSLAKRWYDQDSVDAILDANNSAVALAVQQLTRDKDRVFLITGGSSSLLTGSACSPNGIQWQSDTYSLGRAVALSVLQDGGKNWYFLTVDTALGQALEHDAADVLKSNGGSVVGRSKHPFGASDFAALLLQAQSSGAKVLGLANTAGDMQNAVKQAHEFGLDRQMRVVPLFMLIMDVNGIGLAQMAGARFAEVFYWDTDDATRTWSRRFFATEKHMPTSIQVDAYRATTHYLKAVQAVGTTDAAAVIAHMKQTPIQDALGFGGTIRVDGRVLRDVHYVEVKSPADSKYDWDYYRIIRDLPADQVYRPLDKSDCGFVKALGQPK